MKMVKEKGNYKYDKLDGEYAKWYDNGQLFEKCNYIDGKKEGEYKRWLR